MALVRASTLKPVTVPVSDFEGLIWAGNNATLTSSVAAILLHGLNPMVRRYGLSKLCLNGKKLTVNLIVQAWIYGRGRTVIIREFARGTDAPSGLCPQRLACHRRYPAHRELTICAPAVDLASRMFSFPSPKIITPDTRRFSQSCGLNRTSRVAREITTIRP
jgi:hypothetical protein